MVTSASGLPMTAELATGTFQMVLSSSAGFSGLLGFSGAAGALALFSPASLTYTLSGLVPEAIAALAAASCSSITAVNLSIGCAPLRNTPLMNDAGVPVTPALLPMAMSASILAATSGLAISSLNLARSTPASAAHCSYLSGERSFWLAKAAA